MKHLVLPFPLRTRIPCLGDFSAMYLLPLTTLNDECNSHIPVRASRSPQELGLQVKAQKRH